jgi:DeoR/GlpR family transcriptional regulator of sugar metabolism
MIKIDSQDQLTIEIITKVSQGKITISNAVQLLNRSRRTIERYLHEYKKLGIQFIVHGNTGKMPINKINNKLKLKVQSLIKKKYYDVNLQHLAELLK